MRRDERKPNHPKEVSWSGEWARKGVKPYIYTDLAHPPIKGWGNLAAKRANHTFRDNAPPKGETTLQDIQPQNLQTLRPPNLNTLKPKTAKLTTHKKTTKLGTSTRYPGIKTANDKHIG